MRYVLGNFFKTRFFESLAAQEMGIHRCDISSIENQFYLIPLRDHYKASFDIYFASGLRVYTTYCNELIFLTEKRIKQYTKKLMTSCHSFCLYKCDVLPYYWLWRVFFFLFFFLMDRGHGNFYVLILMKKKIV